VSETCTRGTGISSLDLFLAVQEAQSFPIGLLIVLLSCCRAMHGQLLALRKLVQLLDPPMHAFMEAKSCLNYFFCYRWLLIHFKREFAYDEVSVLCQARHVLRYCVMSCHVMSCHVMSCHVMSCHVMSCHHHLDHSQASVSFDTCIDSCRSCCNKRRIAQLLTLCM